MGPLVTHVLSLPAERYKLLQETRAKAYTDWLKVRELSIQGDPSQAKSFKLEGQAVLNRIVIYGDRYVVNAIYQFALGERDYRPSKNACKESWERDVAIYQAMRRTLPGDDEPVSKNAIALLVLRCNPALR